MGTLTADVSKLSVFKQQKLLASRYFIQAFDSPLGEIVDDIRMRFQDAYVIAHLLCQPQQGRGGVYVCRDAERGALDGDQVEQVACQRRGIGQVGTNGERKRYDFLLFCWHRDWECCCSKEDMDDLNGDSRLRFN